MTCCWNNVCGNDATVFCRPSSMLKAYGFCNEHVPNKDRHKVYVHWIRITYEEYVVMTVHALRSQAPRPAGTEQIDARPCQ